MLLCEAALRYAVEFGWPVFPLAPGSKQPLFANPHPKGSPERVGCHGECGRDGHGLHDATIDPATILRWWGRTPAANIGLATGMPGPDVLDVDVKDGAPGLASLASLENTTILLEGATIIVRTPSGGLHRYGRGQGGQGNGRLPKRGLDFRGAGGYVAAPPSLIGGVPYRFERWEWPLPERGVCWQEIRDHFVRFDPPAPHVERKELPAEEKYDKLLKWVAGAQEGNRNSAIHWAACRLAEGGAPEVYFRDLHVVGVCLGLQTSEVLATIASARRSTP